MQADNFNQPDTLFQGDLPDDGLRIKVIGVGGAGSNTVDRLQLEQFGQVQLAVVNTDTQALAGSPVVDKVMIGRGLTRGLGTGGEVEIGKQAGDRDRDALDKLVAGCDLVFVLAGLGGGTGSAVAPLVCEAATRAEAVVISFVTLPFTFEGQRKKTIADQALVELRQSCDAVIPLPNDVVMQTVSEDAVVLEAFAQADAWISRGVEAICAMLLKTGLINQDFATLKGLFKTRGGKTLFGLGHGDGPTATEDALKDLELCPLLHIPEHARQADNLIVNIIGGTDLGMGSVNRVMRQLTDLFGSRENTVLGALIDDTRRSSIDIVVIGTTDLSAGQGARRRKAGTASDAAGQSADAASDREPLPVHESKLRQPGGPAPVGEQHEFTFLAEEEQRGYFDKTDRNLHRGEDLDVPTYLRRGIKVSLSL
ncbi:MAG: cell division protein FtsZ [Opitutales bacterium]